MGLDWLMGSVKGSGWMMGQGLVKDSDSRMGQDLVMGSGWPTDLGSVKDSGSRMGRGSGLVMVLCQ